MVDKTKEEVFRTQANIFAEQKKKLKKKKVDITSFFLWSFENYLNEFNSKKLKGTLEVFVPKDSIKVSCNVTVPSDVKKFLEDNKLSLAEFGRWLVFTHLDDYLLARDNMLVK